MDELKAELTERIKGKNPEGFVEITAGEWNKISPQKKTLEPAQLINVQVKKVSAVLDSKPAK